MELGQLLESMPKHNASDLHLQVGSPPELRIRGDLVSVDVPGLTTEVVEKLVGPLLTDALRGRLGAERAVDFAHAVAGLARFRVNVFYEKGNLAAAMRLIPTSIPTLESLNLPAVITEIAQAHRGLVLVTGATGSGKTSTLSAMIDEINTKRHKRVITIEDPIEYVHESKKALIAQREVGADASGFNAALREALRQNPDVILIGEMRDRETIETALQAADTGHTVFSTLHTTTAAQTVQRMISFFPADEKERILLDLSASLEAVVCQRLAKTADGKGQIPVTEIMRTNPEIRKLLAEGKVLSIPRVIANKELGMRLFDQHLVELLRADVVTNTEAGRLANNPEAVLLAKRGIASADLVGGLT